MAGINERNVVTPAGFQAHAIAPGTAFTLTSDYSGSTGGVGDRLQRLIVNVLIPATASLTVIDGTREYPMIVPLPTQPAGPLIIELGIYSAIGAWRVVTGSGLSAVAIGSFS